MNSLKIRKRIFRQGLVSSVSFFVNLGLLYVFYSMVGIPYTLAIPLTFVVTTAGNYVLTRKLIFPDTDQKFGKGFIYFAAIMALYVLSVTLAVTLLVEFFNMNVYVARIAVGFLLTGVGFFINGRFNFHVI